MASKVKLPISLVHKGTWFQLVRMLPKHVPEVEALVQQCVQIGSGMYEIKLRHGVEKLSALLALIWDNLLRFPSQRAGYVVVWNRISSCWEEQAVDKTIDRRLISDVMWRTLLSCSWKLETETCQRSNILRVVSIRSRVLEYYKNSKTFATFWGGPLVRATRHIEGVDPMLAILIKSLFCIPYTRNFLLPLWLRHDMEMLSVVPYKEPVMKNFENKNCVSLVVSLSKVLNKQSICRWCEMV